ncbi:hypothetical protein DMN91_010570 [Ooceraea biroi]|uniref:DUF4817 domain-containing protein n=1 Tax=Ooceraea biroi TaxID=2015173 RepID=A0A3L8D8Q7_OOCBI|nr:hypothetical protein DMN91_010570 [Ooceraea biroi]
MVRALRTLVARIRLLITSCPADIVDMIKIVGLCNDNLKAAQRVYAARFPDAQDYEIIASPCSTGSFKT